MQVHSPVCSPQHAALRVVCCLFSLLFTPLRLVLSVLASLYNGPWGTFWIFSANWSGIELISLIIPGQRKKDWYRYLGCATNQYGKKIKPILSIIVAFVIDIIIILRTHWGPLIMLLKSMFSLCSSFSSLGKIQIFW